MRIACVGILVADVICRDIHKMPGRGELSRTGPISLHTGGNAMTAAINLSKLGVDALMLGKVGDDAFGEFLRARLVQHGVDTRGLRADKNTPTASSVVLLDGDGERSFLHHVGANATLSIEDLDLSVVRECDAVFVTGSFLMDRFDGEETAAFLKKCKEMGKVTFLDVCHDARGRWASVLDCAMPYIDFFMPSIDEAVCLAGKEDPDDIAAVFMQKGVKNVVVKVGSKGAYLRLAGEEKGTLYPALRGIHAVDTTGAGDSFCSGFLAAFARGKAPEACIRFANAVGAMCVTAEGATSGTGSYEETLEFLKKHKGDISCL